MLEMAERPLESIPREAVAPHRIETHFETLFALYRSIILAKSNILA